MIFISNITKISNFTDNLLLNYDLNFIEDLVKEIQKIIDIQLFLKEKGYTINASEDQPETLFEVLDTHNLILL